MQRILHDNPANIAARLAREYSSDSHYGNVAEQNQGSAPPFEEYSFM